MLCHVFWSQVEYKIVCFIIIIIIVPTLNQSILALKGKKRKGKEYSEGLHPSFVRYYPIRFYGLQTDHDSDWLIFKTCNSDLMTAPPGSL